MILTTTQKVLAIVEPVDKFGNTATVENVVWVSSDQTVIELGPEIEGTSGLQRYLFAKGATGTCQVSVTADARIGEGEVILACASDITVLPAEAISVGMKFGTVEEQ